MMRTLTFGFLNLNLLPASSAFPLDVIRAASAAGFRSAGIRVTGRRVEDPFPRVVGNREALREIRQAASDAGVRLSSVTGYGLFPDLSLDDHKRVLDAAAELNSELCIMNVYFDDHEEFAAVLGEFAGEAAKRNIRAGVEFMPFSGLRTVQQTTRVLEKAGADNAGYIMDALHLTRSGGTIDDVRAVDPKRIFLGQLCDAKDIKSKRSDDELRSEARAAREYPGEGDVDLFGFIDALPDGMELEIEVPRSDYGSASFEERACKTGGYFRDFMKAYEAVRASVPDVSR